MLPTVLKAHVMDAAIFLKVEGCLAVWCEFATTRSFGSRKNLDQVPLYVFPKGMQVRSVQAYRPTH
jgi:hypothetical protein